MGSIAPKLHQNEAADPLSQRGRPQHNGHEGEALVRLPGFLPPAGVQRTVCAPGRARGVKRRLSGQTSCGSEHDPPAHGQSDWLLGRGDGESP
jgi:hypothetical protein